jgi:hypothetical protein
MDVDRHFSQQIFHEDRSPYCVAVAFFEMIPNVVGRRRLLIFHSLFPVCAGFGRFHDYWTAEKVPGNLQRNQQFVNYRKLKSSYDNKMGGKIRNRKFVSLSYLPVLVQFIAIILAFSGRGNQN